MNEEEFREQPLEEPANVSIETKNECAVSENGSLPDTLIRQDENPEEQTFGKFKSAQALIDAYNNLEAEFTKKCQKLSQLEKDKVEVAPRNFSEQLNQFLLKNEEAMQFKGELENIVSSNNELQKMDNPYEAAWAQLVLSHMHTKKVDDPIINRYLVSSEEIKNKIVESYLDALKEQKSPIIISSQKGERVSSSKPDTPTSLKEAKSLVEKMFS